MPDAEDATEYRRRSQWWRDKAARLPPGEVREACFGIAVGYEQLAAVLESELSEYGHFLGHRKAGPPHCDR